MPSTPLDIPELHDDSHFGPPYRDEPCIEYPTVPLRPHTRLELEEEVKTLHQEALVRLLGEVEVCPEPVPLLVSGECPPSEDILVTSERVHAIMQLITQIQETTHQSLLKRIYKRYLPDHRQAAKCLYMNEHFPLAFTQYRTLLSSLLQSGPSSHLSPSDLQNHTIDLLEKLSVTALRAHWPHDALKFAKAALTLEPSSTRALIWASSAYLALHLLQPAKAHLAALPTAGSFPADFPPWIEQRVRVQRELLDRLEREEVGMFEVGEMEKEEADRVPGVWRSEARLGVVEVPGAGWKTSVAVKKGEVVIVAPPVACAPCYVAGEAGAKKAAVRTGRAVGRGSVRRNTNVTMGSRVPSQRVSSTPGTASPIQASPAKPSHPTASSSRLALDIPLTLDANFSFLLHTDELFSTAAQKAEVELSAPAPPSYANPHSRLGKASSSQPAPDPLLPFLSDPAARPLPHALLPSASPPSAYRFSKPSLPIPSQGSATLHTADPTPLTLSLLTSTLYTAAKTLPGVRGAVRAAAARLSRRAEGVIDLLSGVDGLGRGTGRGSRGRERGCEVRAACLVVAVAFGVAVMPSQDGEGESVYENAYGAQTRHAGHGIYLPLLKMTVAPRGKANTLAGFVGPYLFLRAAKDLPPGTTLTFDGFTGTDVLPVYPPRGGEDGSSRKRKVGIMKNPLGGVVGGFGSAREERQQQMEGEEEEEPMRGEHVLETEPEAAPQTTALLEESLLVGLGEAGRASE